MLVAVMFSESVPLSVGIINVLVTTPMWVVNMRLKLQGKSRQRLHKSRGDDDDHKPLYYSGIIGKATNKLSTLWLFKVSYFLFNVKLCSLLHKLVNFLANCSEFAWLHTCFKLGFEAGRK